MQPLLNFQGSSSVVSVAAFLGTGALIAAALASAAYLAWCGSTRGAKRLLLGAGGLAALYFCALAAVSAGSATRVAAPGVEKYFCEVDCHLAYAVVGARRVPEIGGRKAQGVWQTVTLRVRFDSGTASPRRGDAPLLPHPRRVRLIDDAGRVHAPSPEGERALEAALGRQEPLSRPLRPGESLTTTLVFDVPPTAGSTRLLITEADWVTRLLIGHENSFFHRKTALAVEPTLERTVAR